MPERPTFLTDKQLAAIRERLETRYQDSIYADDLMALLDYIEALTKDRNKLRLAFKTWTGTEAPHAD